MRHKQDESDLYRIKGFCVAFQPQNLQEFCQAYCPSCQDTQSYAKLGTQSHCNQCFEKPELIPVFQVVLVLKDEPSSGSTEYYKLHYYSPVEQAKRDDPFFFCGVRPCNLYSAKNEQVLERIKLCVKLITRFNVALDLLVEGNFYPSLNMELFSLVEGQICLPSHGKSSVSGESGEHQKSASN